MESQDGDIFIDPSSEIGIEEQREILAGIESLTGSPMEETRGERRIKARKKGVLFPLLVNGGAVILLGAGFFILSFFHAHDDMDIRETSAALGITERKLIQEIRKETALRISQKEDEINGMMSRLAEVDAEYQELQASMEREDALNTRQNQENLARLQNLQEDYRNTLSGLRTERARMAEESRTREAALRAQIEEKAAALSSEVEAKEAGLAASLEELRSLRYNQDRALMAENQMEGFYSTIQNNIRGGRFDEAEAAIKGAGEFLLAPSLQGIPAWEGRKKAHRAALDSLETLLAASGTRPAAEGEGARALEEATDAIARLRTENAALEEKNGELERAVRASASEDQGTGRRITGLEASIGELRTQAANQQRILEERDSTIASLKTQNGEQEKLLAEKDRQIGQLNGTIGEMQTTIDDIKRLIGQ
jgi:chromosome segregation ATPase